MHREPHISPYAESLLVHFRRVEFLKQEAVSLPSLDLNQRQLCDLELLLNRAFYPLCGYMGQEDYQSVLERMRLADGTVWPMPVTLDVTEKLAKGLESGASLALRDQEGFLLAVLCVEDTWKADKQAEALAVFGTDDPAVHPGVHRLLTETGSWYVSGKLEGLHLPQHPDFPELRLTPSETHRFFSQRGWRNVAGFQTEQPLHCAHKAMVLRAAREAGTSLFIQPVAGHPRPGDLDHYTMVSCYQEFLKAFPRNMAHLGLITLAGRQAGPREALWEAVVRKNYGCNHFMVSEDHGDPFVHDSRQRFYPLGAAQDLVRGLEEETGVRMVPLRPMVYVEDRAQYVVKTEVTADMTVKDISSAELRRRLEFDLEIPEWFSFPGVVAELKKAYPPRHSQGFSILLTGLSGSGKSTLAKILYVTFMAMRHRPVTLLDGDIVRRNLSSELTFSREHRILNVQRIGFVASEITKNRGIAICAPIAPYEQSRRLAREMVSQYGGYIEVYMSAPLATCEQRDRKGLYAKAKAGIVKGVTGVDDPYEPPTNPELTIDTTEITPQEAAQEILLYLEEQGYIR
ncbi:bifunctional sulfate adenylyltransferase/adenylylsulfate kinase [Desulfonatronum thioautotrophicum]|uniref:bifunctional sulfate adenylyltransferase/adenylylsulfate kinase n=1 Tax=Desulfonatronum thioautotrophicum TaxID=617001 RepID=UPI00069BD35A|nr:bifunctional sulfate adenylyltransferase/adenylylsulfate kinase [Desulfonatronum thioautotrophicum]